MTDEQLSGIRAGDYGVLDADEAVIARAAREMVDHEDLSDATFTELQTLIGHAQVFELTAVVGYYTLLALQLRVLQVSPPGQALLSRHQRRCSGWTGTAATIVLRRLPSPSMVETTSSPSFSHG